jgi:hypothetical protein
MIAVNMEFLSRAKSFGEKEPVLSKVTILKPKGISNPERARAGNSLMKSKKPLRRRQELAK